MRMEKVEILISIAPLLFLVLFGLKRALLPILLLLQTKIYSEQTQEQLQEEVRIRRNRTESGIDFVLVCKLLLQIMSAGLIGVAFISAFPKGPRVPADLGDWLLPVCVYSVGSLLSLSLIYWEHLRNMTSSGTLITFLLIQSSSLGFHLSQNIQSDDFCVLLGASIVLNLFLILLENYSYCLKRPSSATYLSVPTSSSSPDNRSYTDSDLLQECPENTATFVSTITFSWMNHLMRLGYQKPLVHQDLWSLSPQNKSDRLARDFSNSWSKSTPSLVWTFIKCYGADFAFAGIFKFFQDILQFVQPQLLSLLIGFIESRTSNNNDNQPQPITTGFLIAVSMFICGIVQSCLLHQYFHRCIIVGMHVRSGVTTFIYQKSLRLSNASRQQRTIGEIVNLMSVDAQRFMDLCSYLHIAWSGPFQIGIALYLLYQTMGFSIFAGLSVMILMIPINGWLANRQRILQKSQMENKDGRLKMMDEILNGIKVIKLYAWESVFLKQVETVRERELKTLRSIGLLSSIQTFTWACTPLLVSFVTFTTYVLTSSEPLTAQKVFVSISLFNLLTFPLGVFPNVIAGLVEASVAIRRVCKFFLAEELQTDYISKSSSSSPSSSLADSKAGDNENSVISVQTSDFKWDNGDDDEVILREISFSLGRSSLLAVVGRVGSGKSSLISALLGEMYYIQPRSLSIPAGNNSSPVQIRGSIAYVGQQAWIVNATLRDNILFGSVYNADFYQRVLSACGLLMDIESLPGSDLTEIGERGINLSGGQKQRVSIARAVYANCDIYLFDDPLSAVDAHVGRQIFDQVIGPNGLLKGKARLLVTHGIQYIPECDYVMVLDRGRIVEGPDRAKSLLNNETSHISKLIKEYVTSSGPSGGASTTSSATSSDASLSRSSSPVKSVLEKSGNGEMPFKPATSVPDVTNSGVEKLQSNTNLITKEEGAKGSVEWTVYLTYAKSCSYFAISTALVFMILSQVASVSTNIWLKYWSSENARSGGNTSISFFLSVYGSLGIVFSVLTVSQVVIVWVFCAIRSSRVLHQDLLNSVFRSPMSFFDTTPMGRIINRFSKDIYTVDETLPRSFLSYFRTFFSVITILVVVSTSTPLFLVFICPMAFIYYFAQRYYIASSRELKRLDSITRSPIYAHFSETLSGVSTIRAYAQTDRFTTENGVRLDANIEAYYPSVASNRWLAMRLEFLGASVILGSALFAVVGVVYFNNIDAGLAGLSVSYALSVTQTLNWTVRQACEIETNVVSVERIKEYIDLPSESPLVVQTAKPAQSWPARGQIDFVNYSCRYRPGLPLVLDDISFTVQPGHKVGVVGRSGAGKSSLMSGLFRLVEAAAGKLIIDGIDISKIGLADLRSKITIIPQDPVLFATTIRRNLDPFERKSDREIWAAIDAAHLGHKVRSMEFKLDSKVLQNGENFSVGQRQLMCLARAILRQSKVLVLDEATAAIDAQTDETIQMTIRNEFQHCTVLTIAHRINTIMNSDMIVVMDRGHLAEYDSPKKLLSNNKSMFYSLAREAGLA